MLNDMNSASQYWWDDNKNRWSKDKCTYEEALKASESLENCKMCVDCENCKNSGKCVRCTYCGNCSYCSDCYMCLNCCECIECDHCTECDDCVLCKNCIGDKRIECKTRESGKKEHANKKEILNRNSRITHVIRTQDGKIYKKDQYEKMRVIEDKGELFYVGDTVMIDFMTKDKVEYTKTGRIINISSGEILGGIVTLDCSEEYKSEKFEIFGHQITGICKRSDGTEKHTEKETV